MPDGNIAAFVEQKPTRRADSGERSSTRRDGEIAAHAGIHHFTVGQRKGLGLMTVSSDGKPRYVLEIVPDTADVVVGPRRSV